MLIMQDKYGKGDGTIDLKTIDDRLKYKFESSEKKYKDAQAINRRLGITFLTLLTLVIDFEYHSKEQCVLECKSLDLYKPVLKQAEDSDNSDSLDFDDGFIGAPTSNRC